MMAQEQQETIEALSDEPPGCGLSHLSSTYPLPVKLLPVFAVFVDSARYESGGVFFVPKRSIGAI
jgi:hypothetical protein